MRSRGCQYSRYSSDHPLFYGVGISWGWPPLPVNETLFSQLRTVVSLGTVLVHASDVSHMYGWDGVV